MHCCELCQDIDYDLSPHLFDGFSMSAVFDRETQLAIAASQSGPCELPNSCKCCDCTAASSQVWPIELMESAARYDSRPTESGVECRMSVPFIGDPKLWMVDSGSPQSLPLEGQVFNNQVVVGGHFDDNQEARAYFERWLKQVEAILKKQMILIKDFNAHLPTLLDQAANPNKRSLHLLN